MNTRTRFAATNIVILSTLFLLITPLSSYGQVNTPYPYTSVLGDPTSWRTTNNPAQLTYVTNPSVSVLYPISVFWNIVPSGNPLYPVSYTYTFHDPSGTGNPARNISHLLLEVSDKAPASDFLFLSPTEGPQLWTAQQGNPGLPSPLYGIKITPTAGTFTVSFLSTRLPMWGDFYIRDGNTPPPTRTYLAYNTNFGTDPTLLTTNFDGWIPVPDTKRVNVPEPTSILLLGSGLASAFAMRRKRKEQ